MRTNEPKLWNSNKFWALAFKMDIKQLNIETGIFLRQLRLFSQQNSIQVNENTAELFMDVVQTIDQIIGSAEMVPAKNSDSIKFLSDLNEQQFDLRQNIMCRLCIVSIRFVQLRLIFLVNWRLALYLIGANWHFKRRFWHTFTETYTYAKCRSIREKDAVGREKYKWITRIDFTRFGNLSNYIRIWIMCRTILSWIDFRQMCQNAGHRIWLKNWIKEIPEMI